MARVEVAVVGGGAWGLALAGAAARACGSASLLSRRAHDGALPPGVKHLQHEREVGEARLVVLAVPSGVAREVVRSLGAHLDGSHFVVHGVRGLVGDGMETISEVVRDETPVRRLGALGGPALASDLLAGRPSVLVAGSLYPEVTRALEQCFASPTLRLYTTADRLGLEWASALVGCLAIAVGYARGVGLSPGLLAALITRAVEEAGRLTAAAGGKERTLLGLAGYGDLLASISQTERPEVLLGEALAAGRTLEQALSQAGQRVEAVELTGRIAAWAEGAGVPAPIFGALARGILRGVATDALVQELMTGPMVDAST
ncbi:MAG TPA: glycerol-3-phosphate dehydrogenase [Polyangiaceae bacterium]|jgi:glycerol-3-phosphate dehydrogenase (NAD(P)+)